MSDIKDVEISWSEFVNMEVCCDYYLQRARQGMGTSYKFKSGTQWICWTLKNGEFLPSCEGKLKYGSNIL